WAPTDEPLKDNTLIYVISHESREAADKNWKEFSASRAACLMALMKGLGEPIKSERNAPTILST
ncbi:MAG TPA: hypothetical protein VNZ53_01505, partial [Steroidobacteraceae bacterium]|nr:hypothetical protein [Steroidobacteraceae bacterium]